MFFKSTWRNFCVLQVTNGQSRTCSSSSLRVHCRIWNLDEFTNIHVSQDEFSYQYPIETVFFFKSCFLKKNSILLPKVRARRSDSFLGSKYSETFALSRISDNHFWDTSWFPETKCSLSEFFSTNFFQPRFKTPNGFKSRRGQTFFLWQHNLVVFFLVSLTTKTLSASLFVLCSDQVPVIYQQEMECDIFICV